MRRSIASVILVACTSVLVCAATAEAPNAQKAGLVATSAQQPTIRAFTEILEGHQVGGVTIDLVGNLYVADFDDVVWKITPEGERKVFATGFYGASGNAIDAQGNLLQASFYSNAIVRVDRSARAQPFVTSGLSGPVGIAVHPQTGAIYVANCRGNTLARVAANGSVESYIKSDLFKCPNGLAFDRDGALYVTNFRNSSVLKVDAQGSVTAFASVSNKGLGHLCFKDGRFYVTAYESHELYEVSASGKAKRILGNGQRGIVDGAGDTARLSFPNGIACQPYLPRLYINEFVADSTDSLPRRAIVREILLNADK